MKNEKYLLSLDLAPAPDIEIPKPTVEEVQTWYGSTYEKTTHYKGYTAEILNKNLLAVTVYNDDRQAEYRIFIGDYDYVCQYIKKGSLEISKKSTKKPSNMYHFETWRGHPQVFVTDEKNRAAAVKWFKSYETSEPDVFKRICKYVDDIGSQKLKEKHDRIRKSIDDIMLQIRPLPKDFEDWVNKVPFADNRYIMYQYSRRKEMDGYCTHCKQHVKVTGAKHQAKGICPNCKSKITFLAAGRTSDFDVQKDLIYIQKGKNNEIIFRYFYYNRNFCKCRDVLSEHNYMRETEREFYFAEKLFRYDQYGHHAHDWYQIYERHIYTKGYIYYRNIKKMFTEALQQYNHIKYIPFRKLLQNLEPVAAANFYISCISKPQIEYLAKLGLYKLCRELINNDYSELREAEGNIFKTLHIKKDDLQYIQEHDMGYRDIKLYSRCKRYNISIYPEMQYIDKHYTGGTTDRIFALMKHMNFEKIKEYVASQLPTYEKKNADNWYWRQSKEYIASSIISDWKDYLDNCISLEWNISDTKVLKPKNLDERHDITVEIMKLRRHDLEARDIQRRYYEYVFKLAYSDKNYSVIVPRTLQDLKYEGDNLQHCVYTNYATRVAKGESIILFIRNNDEFYKPFVTLELRPETYDKVQMRGFRNRTPNKEVQAFYNKYEKKVLNKLKEQRRAA